MLKQAGAVFLVLAVIFSGCGKKQETAKPQQGPVAEEALPELEQNTLYRTNGVVDTEAVKAEPFEPVSNDLEPVPEDAEKSPLID